MISRAIKGRGRGSRGSSGFIKKKTGIKVQCKDCSEKKQGARGVDRGKDGSRETSRNKSKECVDSKRERERESGVQISHE